MFNKIFYALFGFCICFCIWIGLQPYQDVKFNTENQTDFSTDWILDNASSGSQLINLPNKLNIAQNETLTIEKQLPASLDNYTCFCIRTSQQSIRAYIDETLVYEYGNDSTKRALGKSSGSSWNIVRFPANSENKTLRLEITSPYKHYSGLINSVTLGTQAAITHTIYKHNILGFILAILLFLIGAVLLCTYLIFHRYLSSDKTYFYLGWMSLLSSFWFLGEGKMNQFFFGNQTLVFCIAFLSLMLVTIPLIYFISSIKEVHYYKTLNILTIVSMVIAILTIALQILGISDFYNTVILTHAIILLIIISLFIITLLEVFNKKNNYFKIPCLALGLFCLSGIIELVRFSIISSTEWFNELFVQLGVMTFVILIIGHSIQDTLNSIHTGRKMEYYKTLAMMDTMTNCKNRTAYLDDLSSIKSANHYCAIVTDINFLKIMNEEFGYHVGDQAIIKCSSFLQSIFGTYGTCYRIDGDEFLCLMKDMTEENIAQCLSEFSLLCQTENKKCAYLFQIATGYALFDSSKDTSVEDIVRRAEKNMLLNKNQSKNIILS